MMRYPLGNNSHELVFLWFQRPPHWSGSLERLENSTPDCLKHRQYQPRGGHHAITDLPTAKLKDDVERVDAATPVVPFVDPNPRM